MSVTFKNISESFLYRISFLISLVCCYFLVILLIEPSLVVFTQKTGFLVNVDYLKEFTSTPGGISVYISNFLMQFFNFNFLGSVIILLLISTCIILVNSIASFFFKSYLYKFIVLIFIAGFSMYLFTDYYFYYASYIKLIISLFFAWIIVKVFNLNEWAGHLISIPLMIIVYYLAGALSMYLFSLVLLIYAIYNSSQNLYKLLYAVGIVIINVAICIVFFRVININTEDTWLGYIPQVPVLLRYRQVNQLYLFYFIIVGLIVVSYLISLARNNDLKKFTVRYRWILAIILGIISIASPFSSVFHFDKFIKSKVLVHFYADKRDWDNVIKQTFSTGSYDVLVNAQYNRALHFKGTILEDFFNYPQQMGFDGLIPDKKEVGEVTLICSDIYYDLGYNSEAIHWLYEAQMLMPYSPDLLKRLIQCYMITGKMDLVTKYLDILDQNFMYRNWVKDIRTSLNIYETQATTIKRRNQIPDVRLALSEAKERLKLLLAKDSTNTMAYEYLQLYYLVNNQLGDFYYNLKLLEDAGYKSMPKVFQEAILLYAVRKDLLKDNLEELRVSQDCYLDFKDITEIKMRNRNDPQLAQRLMAKRFYNTYWYYVLYESPLVTKAELKYREVEQ